MTAGFTAAVAEQVTAIRSDCLPAEVAERTRHMLLDWLGVTIAGSAEPSARIAQRVAAAEGGAPLASVVGTGLRTGPQQAALANGVAAHALDYDDGNRWAGAHPSAPIVSAVLALAEARDATGAQAVEAIVAGIQALCLIGYANGPSLWQPPAGCVGVGVINRPEGFVHLKVPSAMSLLTITTANSETNFDTFLFVISGTGSTAGAALGCNDDTQGYTSTVELASVAAGDYTIVVGSTGKTGGEFGVSISGQ